MSWWIESYTNPITTTPVAATPVATPFVLTVANTYCRLYASARHQNLSGHHDTVQWFGCSHNSYCDIDVVKHECIFYKFFISTSSGHKW